MTRPNMLALAVSASAAAIGVASAIATFRSRAAVEAAMVRVDDIESARHNPTLVPIPVSDNSVLARSIAALRVEVAALAGNSPPSATSDADKAAQQAQRQKAWTERMVRAISETLETRLDLSAEQKLQAADILTAQYAALAVPPPGSASMEDRKALAARIYDETATQIRALLSPEQQARFTDLIQNPAGVFGIELIPNAGQLPGERGSSPH